MDVHQRAGRRRRQDAVQQDVGVAARHQDMAGIDEQRVAGLQHVEQVGRCRLQGRGHDAHAGQVDDVGARRGIDGDDLAQPAHRLGQNARRMAGAHLDDVLRLALAHQGVGHGGIERGEPRLVEQAFQALELGGMRVDGVEHAGEGARRFLEQPLDRRIGRLRAGRRQQGRIAVRDEPAARLQAKHGGQSQLQPSPAAAKAWRAHGLSVRPSWATIARGRPLAAVPGRAAAASRATPSMKASSWLGS